MNPGKIVRAAEAWTTARCSASSRVTARAARHGARLVGAEWRARRGFAGAVEMCNNNGHCRKFDAGTMCPSYRATGDEQHLTRGRANTLRLALRASSAPTRSRRTRCTTRCDCACRCKGCKRECPTGVDMAQHEDRVPASLPQAARPDAAATGSSRYLPRYAPWAARLAWLAESARPRCRALRAVAKDCWASRARRSLPRWRRDRSARRAGRDGRRGDRDGEVVLLVDTFNTYFEPENLRAALRVLRGGRLPRARSPRATARAAAVLRPHVSRGRPGRRGARGSAAHARGAAPFVERGVPVVGLEPSCLLGAARRIRALLPGADARRSRAARLLFEEFLVRERDAGRLQADARSRCRSKRALVHGHCHQKAFDVMPAVRGAEARARARGGRRVELLRHGGRVRLRGRALRRVDEDGRARLLPRVRAAGADT